MKTKKENSDQSEKDVKKLHPTANVARDGAMYFVSSGSGADKKDLGAGFSKEAAWNSAKIFISK